MFFPRSPRKCFPCFALGVVSYTGMFLFSFGCWVERDGCLVLVSLLYCCGRLTKSRGNTSRGWTRRWSGLCSTAPGSPRYVLVIAVAPTLHAVSALIGWKTRQCSAEIVFCDSIRLSGGVVRDGGQLDQSHIILAGIVLGQGLEGWRNLGAAV